MMPESRVVDLKLLLQFFARPQQEQWREIPDLSEPVQVQAGDFEFATRMPIRVLAAILVSLLSEFKPSQSLIEVFEEVRVLLYWWMMESTRLEVFSKKEQPQEADVIWRTVSRLCQLALHEPLLVRTFASSQSVARLIPAYSKRIDVKKWGCFPIE